MRGDCDEDDYGAGYDATGHGIDSAYYSNGPGGYRPVLQCVCGFNTSHNCLEWTEAGAEFDEHLASASVGVGRDREPPK